MGSICFLAKQSPLHLRQARNIEKKAVAFSMKYWATSKAQSSEYLESQILCFIDPDMPSSNLQVLTFFSTRISSLSRPENSTFSEALLVLTVNSGFVPIIFCTPAAEDESLYMLLKRPSDYDSSFLMNNYSHPSLFFFVLFFFGGCFFECLPH